MNRASSCRTSVPPRPTLRCRRRAVKLRCSERPRSEVDVFLDRLDARVCEQLVRCGANADAARWLAPAAGCDEPVSSTVYESALLLVFPGQGAEGESCRASTDAGAAQCIDTEK